MQPYAIAASAELTVTQMRQKVMTRNELQQAYLDAWNATITSSADGALPMDCIIMAVSPWAAPRLGVTQEKFYVGYTGVVNYLDFCACTFPVTSVDKDADTAVDMVEFEKKSLGDLDTRIMGDYDAEFYHGAPVALQVVGRRLEEEKVLEMVGVVRKVLEGAGVK